MIDKIDNKPSEYGKDFMKIEFNSDYNLPLNKLLKYRMLTRISRSVFTEDGKYYPQVFLDECLYELKKCCSMKELMFQKELTLIKQRNEKNLCFAIFGIFKDIGFKI